MRAVYSRLEISQSKVCIYVYRLLFLSHHIIQPAEPTSTTSDVAIELCVPADMNEVLPDISRQTTATPTVRATQVTNPQYYSAVTRARGFEKTHALTKCNGKYTEDCRTAERLVG